MLNLTAMILVSSLTLSSPDKSFSIRFFEYLAACWAVEFSIIGNEPSDLPQVYDENN